jgi:hypothetical protein
MNDDLLRHNRVILCHFDTYSTALLFARYGASVLAPTPLPEGAGAIPAAEAAGAQYEPAAALGALAAQYGLDTTQLRLVDGFNEWMSSADGAIRIHLARFMSFEAPRDAIEPKGGVFKPISEMRGMAALELGLLRRAFNLFMGGN